MTVEIDSPAPDALGEAREAQFKALLERYYRKNARRLERIWRGSLHGRHDHGVEDVVQASIVRVYSCYRHAEQRPRNEAELDSLMHTVIKNYIRDLIGSQKPTRSLDEGWSRRDDEEPPPIDPQDPNLTAEDQVRLKSLIRRALAPLQPQYRLTLDMYCIQGYAMKEIAGGPSRVGYSKKLVFRELDKLAGEGDSDAAMLKEHCQRQATSGSPAA
jgi:RNA polymerase sigma factor (sigma-70 family)